ncbi:HAD family hydrolase [Candidatus Venteria ishoeyi]|uniref:Mitochondrial PGP phosphatase n=1 Tax=Candidatus Venteria ishoeyi TaxID=1899563 RepID=A0A1H6FBD0_9GAMM|nr:HAD family hydrolase [Candidatus Venteria ishoeyi]SEH06681.1 Uncharacterised protein [Candidatus Venteria ishoeyi]
MSHLLKRSFYALQQAWSYRHCLQQAQQNRQCADISTLLPQDLQQQGISVLVLDFDGVLASHGEIAPAPTVQSWLKQCTASTDIQQIYLLTNKPMSARFAWFEQHFPQVQCFISPSKKPYPDGLLAIAKQSGQPVEKLLLVDDRLLTGVLAACIAKVPVLWLNQPLTNFRKRPLQESFFMLLRKMDKLLLGLFKVFH